MLTKRQELFTLNLFQGMSQREAWGRAGYSTNYPVEDIDANACILAKTTKVKQRLAELRAKVESPTIASVTERRERLSEIIRARITDFQSSDGIYVDKDIPNTGAIESLETIHRVSRDSQAGSISIKRPVVPESLRNEIFERDGNKCVQCSSTDRLQLDHIIALSKGGQTVKDNLQTLCEECNKTKAAGKKSQANTITKLKLHDPIEAIDLLNKMDHIYSDVGNIINQDNRQINIYVKDAEAKELLKRVSDRTKKDAIQEQRTEN